MNSLLLFSTAENLQRLEELPTFTSCIKPFGKPILPPLLTLQKRNEISQHRVAAAEKEAKLLYERKKQFNICRKESNIYTNNEKYPAACDECDSLFIHTDGADALLSSMSRVFRSNLTTAKTVSSEIHVAMSKIPTNDICSTVHKGAIVCSNVVSNHKYGETTHNSTDSTEKSIASYTECSLQDCHLCQVEYTQDFSRNNFSLEGNDESSELYSPRQKIRESDDDQNSVVEETECSSLPTVIYNKKFIINDTDSESNVTTLTQSTDLEKYMDFPFELYSPDCLVAGWDSKTINHQSIASKSDDASSETIVNTENELTPCASMLAEFTDPFEDQLSSSSDTKQNVRTENSSEFHRRAHSVDSYMKILKTCAQNLYVRKSQSEPSHADISYKTNSVGEFSFNISRSVVESKEESEALKNGDKMNMNNVNSSVCASNTTTVCTFSSSDSSLALKSDEKESFVRRHVRRNSYTLEQPSSALIKAHADCECSLDAERYCSPHCSGLQSSNLSNPLSAFRKEKLNVVLSPRHAKRFQIQNSAVSVDSVISDWNTVQTSVSKSCEPLVENDQNLELEMDNLNISNKLPCSDAVSEKKYFSDSSHDPNTSEKLLLSQIYYDLQEKQKMKVEKLLHEQNKQWLKLHEEFKEQERSLCEKLNIFEISKFDEDDSKHLTSHDHTYKYVKDRNSTIEMPKSTPLTYQNEKNNSYPTFSTSENHETAQEILTNDDSFILVMDKTKTSVCTTSDTINYNSKFDEQETSHTSEIKTENEYKMNEKRHPDVDLSTDIYLSVKNRTHIKDQLKTNDLGQNDVGQVLLARCTTTDETSFPVEEITYADIGKKVTHNCVSTSSCSEASQDDIIMINGFVEHETRELHFSSADGYHSTKENPDIIASQNLIENEFNQTRNSTLSDVNFDVSNAAAESNAKVIASTSNEFNNLPNSLISCEEAVDLSSEKQILGACAPSDATGFTCSKSKLESETYELLPTKIAKLPVSISLSHIHAKVMKQHISLPTSKEKESSDMLNDPVLNKKFERLPALVKGYLTRRLFKTERVQGLIKTLQDTAVLIKKLSDDLSSKGNSVSERDVDFHRQLIVQLMTTFHSVYDIFCTISTKEQMSIIAESRNFVQKQNIKAAQNCDADPVVPAKVPTPALNKKHKLSSATLKTLERKKRFPIDSRTYTIEDFKSFRKRSCSSISSKSSVPSPSSIYKVSVGLSPKRKTTSIKRSSGSRRLCLK